MTRIIALGAVIRGETPHFDYVAGEAARGLQQVALETGAGRVRRSDHRYAGAGRSTRRRPRRTWNKGYDAAMTAIEMARFGEMRSASTNMPARHRSRQRALQVLFLWDIRKQPIEDAIASFYETLVERRKISPSPPLPDEFMEALVRGASANAPQIDRHITEKSEHWRLERMPAVDRNILRLAVYEMKELETPAPVVIDEALELARQFSGDESVAFINGVLDAVHRER